MLRIPVISALATLALAGCKEDIASVTLGEVTEASYETKTGEPWPLTIAGGELFCEYRDVSLGDDFLLWIRSGGEDYALNTTARFLLNDGDAKNWEDIWKRQPDGDRYISTKPFLTYVPDRCRTG